MRVMLLVLVAVVAGTLAGAGEEHVRLFKELSSGMSYDEVSRLPGMQPETSAEHPNVRLSRQSEQFAGFEWREHLAFRNDRLTDVILMTDYRSDVYGAVLQVFAAGFSLMHVQSLEQVADCFLLLKTNPIEDVSKFIDKFESDATAAGFIQITYLDTASFEEVIPDYDVQGSSSQIAQLLPSNARVAVFTASRLRDGDDQPFLRVIFSTPVYTAKLLKKD